MHDLGTIQRMNAEAVELLKSDAGKEAKIAVAIPTMIYEFDLLDPGKEEEFLDKWVEYLMKL